MSFHVPEEFRVVVGSMASDKSYVNNSAFKVRLRYSRRVFVIASDGQGWKHVSVSTPDTTPTWEQMCEIKDIFWDAEDCVAQFHPPRSVYVDMHPHCLHLWRCPARDWILPPADLVGFRDVVVSGERQKP